MPPPRFGASKFRNAAPHFPPAQEWYRGNLPAGTTSSSTSTFSSELKTSRRWVVSLTSAGDLTVRGYQSGETKTLKLGGGGGVGDWDLSRLEDGLVAVGGLDGSISSFIIDRTGEFIPSHSIPASGSPITTLALHPTTPALLLASSVKVPLAVYNLSNPTPVINLNTKEPKGLWTAGWSPDGKRLAAIGKSGTAYVFTPRESSEPTVTKTLMIQALKPVKIAWVQNDEQDGTNDIFITAFDKSRNRIFALLSSHNLSTTFSQSVDTTNSPLIPLIDHERRIVYAAARGDMSLRQIELSGATGFQETMHALPSPVASAGLALVHPTVLEVMQAEIARVLVPVVDKDGDAILPVGIKVPRRQLIDYHEDLYPDIKWTIPEHGPTDWLNGQDVPLSTITLHPSHRSTWEERLHRHAHSHLATHAESAPEVKASQAESAAVPLASSTTIAAPSSTSQGALPSDPSRNSPADPNLPLLEDGESYSSTSYKVRIIASHVAEQHRSHQQGGSKSPLLVGLQGPQGCGKTTLCDTLVARLKDKHGLTAAVLSLDDLYRTNAGLKDLAKKHPENKQLAGRGPPGTHDVELAQSVLKSVSAINDDLSGTVALPIFDKSLCGGEGDRSSETNKITSPIDVFVLEGWSMGFSALPESTLKALYSSQETPYTSSKTKYFPKHTLESLLELNTYLAEFSAIYSKFHTIVQVEPDDYEHVFKWRLQQEHGMKAKNGGKGMTDEQVQAFVERYMPSYEIWRQGVWDDERPWAGKGLRLFYGSEREVVKVEKPVSGAKPPAATNAQKQNPEPKSVSAPPGVKSTEVKETPPATSTDSASVKPAEAVGSVPAKTLSPGAVPASSASTTFSDKPYNPGWSRKFLSAKSPLIPAYDSLPPLATLHQDSIVFKTTKHLAFFPVQGPGGRLGVHALKKRGRMVTGGEGYLSGGVEIASFDVEPFETASPRVAIAGEDGVIRVWTVGEDGVEGVGPEPTLLLKGKGIDKIAQIAFHPTALNLITAVTNEQGSGAFRFWDLASSEELEQVQVEVGVFHFTWSPYGDRVAAAAKDGRILVLDPRQPAGVKYGKAHDSPRSFQISWISKTYLVSIGFARGSQRKINLYEITDSEVKTISTFTIDTSPSVLFPVYDPDTSILYVWGKGERSIQAYEIHPEHATEPIAKLPGFNAAAGTPQLGVWWSPKKDVDVKKVEVGKALRLTAKTIEEISFTIPRNKPDFFQDDIYTPTLDTSKHSTTAAEWMAGADPSPEVISLQPRGMTPLSQAPVTTSAAKKKFVPAANVMSEAEKKKKEMDDLFQKAKGLESSSDEDDRGKGGLDPPDDDW